MANNIGVTGSVIAGNTLTVTFGITGDIAVEDATLYLSFDPSGVNDVVVNNLAGFAFLEDNENSPGEWTVAGISLSAFSPGTDLFSVDLTFATPPASFDVAVSGSFGTTDLAPTDVELFDGSFTETEQGSNSAPVGVPDQLAATEDTPVTFSADAVLENDTDEDEDTLAIQSVSAVSGGAVSLVDGDIQFTPDDNFNGQATFTYVASDGNGGVTEETSVTVNVAPANDPATGSVTITGVPEEDQQLTASNTLADIDGLGEISYQWRRNGVDIAGADGDTYTLTAADVGTGISVVASFTDGDGTVETVESAATATVVASNLPPDGIVLVQGDIAVGATLTAVRDFVDPDGIATPLSYQWLRDGSDIAGAVAQNYVLSEDDLGALVSVRVSYTDGDGEGESIVSYELLIDPDNTPATGTPVIEGALVEGEQLTVGTSGIADVDGLGPFSYQWFRDGDVIAGATAAFHTLTAADVGSAISVAVSFSDGGGALEQLLSAETDPIADISASNNAPTGLAMIYGDAEPGEVLQVITDAIGDADGLGDFSYQWFVDGQAVDGATGDSFALPQESAGASVDVTVSYRDGAGFDEVVEAGERLVNEPSSDAFFDLIEVYVIILGRAPDSSGLDFWTSKILGGRTFEDVASAMWNSPGAREVYPPELSVEEQVTSFYENILDRAPDEGGLAFWASRWESLGPVETMLRMINALSANNSSDPDAIADKVLFQAKVDIGGYLANDQQSDDVELAASAFEYLEAGNSLAQTIAYVDGQLEAIGQAPAEELPLV